MPCFSFFSFLLFVYEIFIYKSQHPQRTLTELSLCLRYFFCMISAYRQKIKNHLFPDGEPKNMRTRLWQNMEKAPADIFIHRRFSC